MKRKLFVIYKIMFWCYFIYNLGWIQTLISSSGTQTSDPCMIQITSKKGETVEDRIKHEIQLSRLYEKLVLQAQAQVKKGIVYRPEDYFRDLKKVVDFRIQHHVVQDVMFAELQGLMQKGFKTDPHGESRIDQARNNAFPGDKAYHEKEAAEPVFRPLCHWLLWLYLKMVPAAFFLLLIWGYEHDEKKIRCLKNPMSFIISLLLHPIVISIVVRQQLKETSREWWAETEIRRTKEKALSLLTDDEIALVKQFANTTLSRKAFRQHLIVSGRVFHHSFCAIAMLSLLCCFVAKGNVKKKDTVITKEHTVKVHAHVARSSIVVNNTVDIGIVHDCFTGYAVWRGMIIEILQRYRNEISYLLLQGYPPGIGHVPLRLTHFIQTINMMLIKNKHNENTYYLYQPFLGN